MLWFKESKRSFVERFCMNVLKCGPIPRHVAFIMDGNRRYAKKLNLETIEGHKQGFDKMAQMLEWCLELGVNEVTVYAFSIDNFQRSKEEVDKLLDFAKEMFEKLIEEKHKLNDSGKCIRVFGNLSLLSVEIQKLIAEIVVSTQENGQKFLNICFAYTSRHEITNAIKELNHCVNNNIIKTNDINESLLSKFLYTTHSSEPDLLVRTSGEVRLSDFLLWQTSYSVIAFADVLWPEFTIWDLFAAVFYYQRQCPSTKANKEKYEKKRKSLEDKLIKTEFELSDEIDLEKFLNARNQRLDNCLQYLENKRTNQLKLMANRSITAKS